MSAANALSPYPSDGAQSARIGGAPGPDAALDAPSRGSSASSSSSFDVAASTTSFNLCDALSPLVTGVLPGAHAPHRERRAPDSPMRATTKAAQDARRLALQQAVAELAATHAVAAELAARRASIDLPLDLPDAVVPDAPVADVEAGPSPLVVPDMIRACRDRVAAYASTGDRMKIDIVATLFDQVLADDRLSTDIRTSLARLQLPTLRIALLDESFFASRTHPTRRLLDRLAAAAAQWKLDTEPGQASRAELERAVCAIVQCPGGDAGDHARVLESFERKLEEIANAPKVSSSHAITDPEDRDVLVIKATIQISQLLAGVDVDRAIRFFLLDVWSRVLVELTCLEASSTRDAMLARAKRLCFDLAWSAAPKTTTGERARLAGLLPTMIAALREGMAMIACPKADEERFMAQWTRALYAATKRSHLVHDGRLPTRPDDPIPASGLDIDDFARRLREGSFGVEPMRTMLDVETVANEGLKPLGQEGPSLMSTDLSGERRGAAKRPPPPKPVIAELKKGAWFELRDRAGYARVRLSWISPLKSFYLFVGADSALTRSFDPEALADLIERGDLRGIR